MSAKTAPVLPGDDPAAIARAAALLRAGELVAFPTETVYGLGADALDPAAVAKIFAAKRRPADNPLIVHVADAAAARAVTAAWPAAAATAAAALWPGPLTLVLPRAPTVPDATTAGQATVGVRVPDHPVALALLRACGRPLAAPSANRSGRPSPTLAAHVAADLGDEVALILDGGAPRVGLESTVLDLSGARPLLLRRGGVTLETLRALLGAVDGLEGHDLEAMSRSPGLRHRHYAPRARVELVPEGAGEAAARPRTPGERVALVVRRPLAGAAVLPADLEGFARGLFATLRALDADGVDRIVVEAVPETGLGAAIMDRLRRAAEG
jgi:L-threonylcarbamoyladenylate synthase